MSVTARETALNVLLAVRRQGARPELILSQEIRKNGMDRRDAALAMELANGVLQNTLLLDHCIGAYCNVPLPRLETAVHEILRLSVYQLLFLDRVPARAVVSEGVELTKKRSKRASGLVNAVLRRAAGAGRCIPEIKGTAEERLSVRYSHPLWLVRRFINQYSEETCERILAAGNMRPSVTVQTNTLRATCRELAELLRAEGVEVREHEADGDALTVAGTGDITALEPYKKGLFYVQDMSAKMAVRAASPKQGTTAADVCAAPGGKSFAAAIMMENRGLVHSFDIHENKLSLIIKGAERLGLDIVKTACRNAMEPDAELEGTCDTVFADVPCSGFGVIRKKPEIRLKKEEEISRLPEIQLGILRGAARLVRNGGVLLYSTCTILREENEDVITAFLDENSDFEREGFDLPEPYGCADGMRTVLPFKGDTDGFFICRLRRRR